MENIPHYLIDIVYPDEEFTVADYKHYAENTLIKLIKQKKFL